MFWPSGADVDRNGCDQRNDVLHRDLTEVEVREGTQGCVVIAGVLDDPYTGLTVPFAKSDAAEVPIDHVVPLAAGAAEWSADQRRIFANDLANLVATTRSENSSKGDSIADEWVPADPSYGCSCATVVITVKSSYSLTVTPSGVRCAAVAARHLLSPRPACPGDRRLRPSWYPARRHRR